MNNYKIRYSMYFGFSILRFTDMLVSVFVTICEHKRPFSINLHWWRYIPKPINIKYYTLTEIRQGLYPIHRKLISHFGRGAPSAVSSKCSVFSLAKSGNSLYSYSIHDLYIMSPNFTCIYEKLTNMLYFLNHECISFLLILYSALWIPFPYSIHTDMYYTLIPLYLIL